MHVLPRLRGKGAHKFENLWLKAEGFVEKVKNLQNSYNFNGSPSYILTRKLKAFTEGLKNWNKIEF